MKKHLIFFIICISSYCIGQEKNSQSEKEFDLFWTTFKKNYAFFNLKKINWDSIYNVYRPKVTNTSTQEELIKLFSEMVEPLKDGHITISKNDAVLYKGKTKSKFKQELKGVEKEFWSTVDLTLQKNKFSKIKKLGLVFRNESFINYTENKSTGYIRINRCFNDYESLFDDKKEELDTQEMLTYFKKLLVKFKNKKTIIIDLRNNGGGHAGKEMAALLVNSNRISHYVAKFENEKVGTIEKIEVEKNPSLVFNSQIILLTSDKTASSAEDFTLSLKEQNNVITIGTHTAGMLSDMFSTELNNEISFTLSNQIYFDLNHNYLEDKGIPVTIEIWNSKQDIEKKADPVLEETFKFIAQKI